MLGHALKKDSSPNATMMYFRKVVAARIAPARADDGKQSNNPFLLNNPALTR
jgi:hypothetical protein